MRKAIYAGLFALVIGCSDAGKVDRVIDGDTFVLTTGEKVRLICIDTPEKGDPYHLDAKKHLESLVLGYEVKLEKDKSEKDNYGRLLRYAYVNGAFVNEEMAKEGLAKAYRYGKDTKLCPTIEDAVDRAKRAKLNIWREVICDRDFYNCADFKTQSEAQSVYDKCGPKDVHKLDVNKDGKACDSLN